MPFDPALPATGSALDSAVMRGQLTGLKDLIDAVPAVTGAVVDSVTPLPPGDSPTASVALIDGVLHFSFGLPASGG
ncbi:MAG TPA: hypothetical protein DIT13_01420 [Verrucomicrobiales bacterium]|nr:hypothetical protein [Verrucomicrobiales bacterium]HRJ08968.1 hypothetical protein [Prosthecobacter sp.]HRK13710.1 hypothetical protein [Prosthecobacter sp.]